MKFVLFLYNCSGKIEIFFIGRYRKEKEKYVFDVLQESEIINWTMFLVCETYCQMHYMSRRLIFMQHFWTMRQYL